MMAAAVVAPCALACAFAICALVLRRHRPSTRGGRLIELAGSTYLTPQITLHVVSAAGRSLLVAAGPAGVTLLAELPPGSHAADARRSDDGCACSSSTMRP
jgi:flagellar biogenesis protein FliO